MTKNTFLIKSMASGASKLAAIAAFMCIQVFALASPTVHASESALLIFDASRSMWGKIDGKSRIVIAREVLGEAFLRYETKLKLGIIAYGNRSHSNCRDINHVKSVGRIRAVSYTKAVRRIKPRGKTPIARSLRVAANRLNYKNKKATLILMSDGLDNCNGNPCAIAKSLEESANFLTIHVIAFSVPKEDHPGLLCIARNTGGKFFTARNGPELAAAFDRVVNEILTASVPIPVAAPRRNTPELDKLAAVKAEADVETRKLIGALEARAQENAEIESRQSTNTSTTKSVGNGKIITIEPSNGRKIAAALLENPMRPNILVINKDVKQGTEGLELSAKLSSESPPLIANIKWEIYNFEKSSDGNRAQIVTTDVSQPTLPLAPGRYIVRAVFGVSSTAKVVKITTAQVTDATFILNVGGIRVKPLLIAGEPPDGKIPHQWIYLVSKADSLASPELIATADDPKKIHQLAAGTYELISRFGTANAVVKTNVTVSPGLLTEVEVSHKASIVQFKLFKKWRGGEELMDVSWKLLDDEDNVIAKNLNANAGEIIAPGRYKIVALYNNTTYSKIFKVKPGKKKLIKVVAR